MPSSTVTVERLRHETRALHDSIESSIPILHVDATASTYRVYLSALLGFHTPIEERLRQIPAVRTLPIDIDQRWKVPALVADLQSLCADDEPGWSVGSCEIPPLDTVPQALGCLYVVEGATLGGRVIYRHLLQHMPELAASAARYLHGYGAGTRARWEQLCTTLNAQRPDDAEAIVHSARLTFATFAAWIQHYARPRWIDEGLIR